LWWRPVKRVNRSPTGTTITPDAFIIDWFTIRDMPGAEEDATLLCLPGLRRGRVGLPSDLAIDGKNADKTLQNRSS
jgi:hypothetical protein